MVNFSFDATSVILIWEKRDDDLTLDGKKHLSQAIIRRRTNQKQTKQSVKIVEEDWKRSVDSVLEMRNERKLSSSRMYWMTNKWD